MKDQITVRCINTGKKHQIEAGSTIAEICDILLPGKSNKIVTAHVNNISRGLGYRIFRNKDIELLGMETHEGKRAYIRSLLFVMSKAVKDILHASVTVENPISGGYYCTIHPDKEISQELLYDICHQMDCLIQQDIPFEFHNCPTEEAIEVFKRFGMDSKVKLLNSVEKLYSSYYTLLDEPDYFYGELMPSTGYIKNYGLMRYADGLLLRVPQPTNMQELIPLTKQEKMLDVFTDHHKWQNIIRLSTIGELNEAVEKGYTNELINISEALQEKKICQIAEAIQKRPQVRMILIAGPSSSGKTTFSKRISVQLAVCGLRTIAFSMDDYFVDRSLTPRDENGEYDFESVDALNIPLLEEHLTKLFQGEEVELPRFNFQTGLSEPSGKKLRIDDTTIIVMEGIHALNPKLTQDISDALKYKIFVSALTTIRLDDHNYIPTTDNRLLRRIVRDFRYRGYSAYDTIHRWPSVTAGEDKWITPFQEYADTMFNSALLFELAGLREQALPLLEMVPENVPEHAEAHRLIKFLNYIKPLHTDKLPHTSLLREFLGGSSFHY